MIGRDTRPSAAVIVGAASWAKPLQSTESLAGGYNYGREAVAGAA